MALFEKIAVASTFSPRFRPLLAEARTFAKQFGAALSVIHVGDENEEKKEQFSAAFRELTVTPGTPIHWAHGAPADSILEVIGDEKMNLVIAGALEKVTQGRHFLGDVARKLMREADCSLLLFTNPQIEPRPFRTIVVITDFSAHSEKVLRAAMTIAEANAAEKIHLVRICTAFAQARAGRGSDERPLVETEEARLNEIVARMKSRVPIHPMCVEGTTGFAASDYVQSVHADLLVLPSEKTDGTNRFPSGMDWILDLIPTNLLVLRK